MTTLELAQMLSQRLAEQDGVNEINSDLLDRLRIQCEEEQINRMAALYEEV